MKKILSLALILMVCCTSALLFAGCEGNSAYLEITGGTPTETTDSQGRTIHLFEFGKYEGSAMAQMEEERRQLGEVLYVTLYTEKGSDETIQDTILLSELDGYHLTGFYLTKPGTRTAKLSYRGATATFQYTVNDTTNG